MCPRTVSTAEAASAASSAAGLGLTAGPSSSLGARHSIKAGDEVEFVLDFCPKLDGGGGRSTVAQPQPQPRRLLLLLYLDLSLCRLLSARVLLAVTAVNPNSTYVPTPMYAVVHTGRKRGLAFAEQKLFTVFPPP